jgi:hypothetical protein
VENVEVVQDDNQKGAASIESYSHNRQQAKLNRKGATAT